jgi:hypothetical protein
MLKAVLILKDNSKMKRKFIKLTVGMFLLVGANSVQAQDPQTNKINVVTTAVPFLRISPDARAGGMGDLGLATSPDASSPFWNLAKTPFAQKNFSIGLTYTPWLKDLGLNDVYLLGLSGYYKLDEESALGGSIRYFSLGNIQFTDQGGTDLGSGRPREFGVDFGYSRKLSDKIGLGSPTSACAYARAVTGTSPRLPSAMTSRPWSRAVATTFSSATQPLTPRRSKQASCNLTAMQLDAVASITARQCAVTASSTASAPPATGHRRAGSGSRPRTIWLRRSSTSAATRSAKCVRRFP